MLEQLRTLEKAADLASRTTASDSSETTAAVTSTATAGEEMGAAAENKNDAVPEQRATSPATAVSVLTRDQALQLLIPTRREEVAAAARMRYRLKSKAATAAGDESAEAETETETESGGDSLLEGKFVNLVDLLLPVPTKGEFDVKKIKSSLYFFS
jgi:hypothetical protein